MKKVILALLSLAVVALSGVANSAPVTVNLVADNQRTSSGTLATLVWKTCGPSYVAPCIDPANPWVIANSVTGSTATWTWDAATGVLASSGLYWVTSYISSNPSSSSVISDRVMDLTIDTIKQVTTASNYVCIEGNFLAAVGANGCGNYGLGLNAVNNSSMAYNVGGSPYCVQRTLNPDDVGAGNPRGVTGASPNGCDSTDGAFLQYTIVQDDTALGGQLRLSNPDPVSGGAWAAECYNNPAKLVACAGVDYLTFTAVPIPPASWLLATGIAGLGGRRWLRQKASD